MVDFATRFPVKKSIKNSEFSELAIEWLKGIKKSEVLTKYIDQKMYDDDARIEGENGELFSLKSVSSDNVSSIGLCHDMPDGYGRLWRTECVLTHLPQKSWIYAKSRCILLEPDAQVGTPKKPYLVKMMLKNGWAEKDGDRVVFDRHYNLHETDLDLAARIVLGTENAILPFVYVSRNDANGTIVDSEKLAFELGGLAHVYVEPSRSFSIKLMGLTSQKNPYGGNVAVCVPSNGVIKKFYKRDANDTARKISDAVTRATVRYLSNQAGHEALDWRDLQELQGKTLRNSLEEKIKHQGIASQEDVAEYIRVFDEETRSKNEKISNLEQELKYTRDELSTYELPDGGLINAELASSVAKELYPSEISDRVRKVIVRYIQGYASSQSEREHYILERILEKSSFSGRSAGLVNQIKSAGKDSSTMSPQLGSILSGFGFLKTEDGKHLKYTPPIELGGLPVEILPKTPSDHRAGKNKANEIIENFAIKRLDKE